MSSEGSKEPPWQPLPDDGSRRVAHNTSVSWIGKSESLTYTFLQRIEPFFPPCGLALLVAGL